MDIGKLDHRVGAELEPVGDQTVGGVVWRYSDRHTIPHQHANLEFLHFARQTRGYTDAVVEHDEVIAASRLIRHLSFKSNEVFSRQGGSRRCGR